MYNRTAKSLPPVGEVLAVIHIVPGRGGEQIDEEATWNGEMWTRRRNGELVQKGYFDLWRRLET